MPLPPDDPRHGTSNGYHNLGCRCEACREANRVSHAAYMDKVRLEGRQLGQHGTSLRYDSGCRCERCKCEHNRRSREYKRKRRESTTDHRPNTD